MSFKKSRERMRIKHELIQNGTIDEVATIVTCAEKNSLFVSVFDLKANGLFQVFIITTECRFSKKSTLTAREIVDMDLLEIHYECYPSYDEPIKKIIYNEQTRFQPSRDSADAELYVGSRN